MTMIELGDVSEPAAPGPEGAAPFRRRTRSRAAAAVLAVLCAIGLTGSVRPGPPTVRQLWSMPVPDGGYPDYVDGQAVLFRTEPGGAVLTAYDLATGKVRWATPMGPEPTWTMPREAAHRLYVADHLNTLLEDGSPAFFASATAALDSRTGAVSWRHSGQMMAGDATTALFADWDGRGRIASLHLVRAADGVPIWDRAIDPAQALVAPDYPAAPDQVVAVTAAGTLTTFRYADGEPLATRRSSPLAREPWMALMTDGRLIDIRYGADPSVTAYQAGTLTELWHSSGLGPDVNVNTCDPTLCLADREVLHVLDPRTGEEHWTARQTGAVPIGAGRLLVNSSGMSNSRIVDATTGRTLTGVVDGTALFPPRDDGALLVLRPWGYPDLRTAVLRLDPATGRTTLLGTLQRLAGDCRPVGRYLTCVDADTVLSVTDVG
ncbi:PQQ-binding-like beta-propeller repeat protein [Actinoplanes oblitus]|uniref:PQQ-binding-like beta-propeller repeat protein n=1 Tax=Actinoplanes oblitus TaxID=3040509 RepID=A0ABY8WCM0_9ACTN|nr:PQQ-binding-like beta-propeller repeat protein [Actinoplanes oblitus]WIM95621.1 PQQ-binding-like beta-propeller repeat protein [Actinoplanes oblitus]